MSTVAFVSHIVFPDVFESLFLSSAASQFPVSVQHPPKLALLLSVAFSEVSRDRFVCMVGESPSELHLI